MGSVQKQFCSARTAVTGDCAYHISDRDGRWWSIIHHTLRITPYLVGLYAFDVAEKMGELTINHKHAHFGPFKPPTVRSVGPIAHSHRKLCELGTLHIFIGCRQIPIASHSHAQLRLMH